MSKLDYSSILVVQIKTTCFENDDSLKNKQIIEFGSCLLNTKTLRTHEPFSVIVNSDLEITPFCTARTNLTPEDVASGVSFCDLMETVQDIYGPYRRPWASYGSFALQVTRKQCADTRIPYPFSDRFVNIKCLAPIVFNLPEELSLNGIIKKFKLTIPEGKDAQDDALNAALVLRETLRGGPLP